MIDDLAKRVTAALHNGTLTATTIRPDFSESGYILSMEPPSSACSIAETVLQQAGTQAGSQMLIDCAPILDQLFDNQATEKR